MVLIKYDYLILWAYFIKKDVRLSNLLNYYLLSGETKSLSHCRSCVQLLSASESASVLWGLYSLLCFCFILYIPSFPLCSLTKYLDIQHLCCILKSHEENESVFNTIASPWYMGNVSNCQRGGYERRGKRWKGLKGQTSSYKVNKPRGYNLQCKEYGQ